MQPLKIFYSYAHEDKSMRAELGKHLAICRSQCLCQDWSDGDIVAGDDWDTEIKDRLRTSDIILLLISADFLDSSYIQSVEMQESIKRHQSKEARVIPIMLRPCEFGGAVFSGIQGLPTDMRPVTKWEDRDEAWTDVVRGLKKVFKVIHQSSNGNGHETAPAATQAPEQAPMSPELLRDPAQEENRVLAEALTQGSKGLSELIEGSGKIREFVAEEWDELVDAENALQVLVDYKNVHDRLHDLQFKCYNFIFEEARKIEEQINWPLLVRPQTDLVAIGEALQQAATQPALEDEDFSWLESLAGAAAQFNAATQELTLAPLQQAAQIIRGILEKWPTVFDAKLCAAAKTLPLDELREAMEIVRAKMSPAALGSEAGMRFSAGVDALPQLSENLSALTDEHNRWQVVASEFWRIDALIVQDVEDLRRSWPKLRGRLQRLCANKPARWATAILDSVTQLDTLLTNPAPGDQPREVQRWLIKVRQTYASCSNQGGTQFYQVDLSLKRLCDELRDVQAALATLLAALP